MRRIRRIIGGYCHVVTMQQADRWLFIKESPALLGGHSAVNCENGRFLPVSLSGLVAEICQCPKENHVISVRMVLRRADVVIPDYLWPSRPEVGAAGLGAAPRHPPFRSASPSTAEHRNKD